MTGFTTRWPVRIERTALSGDCDGDGAVAYEVLARWLVDVATAVVDACDPIREELGREHSTIDYRQVRVAGDVAGPAEVEIVGGVTEVLPHSLTVAARFRPMHADGLANGSCIVRLVGEGGASLPITKEVRDALIAMAHGARFYG